MHSYLTSSAIYSSTGDSDPELPDENVKNQNKHLFKMFFPFSSGTFGLMDESRSFPDAGIGTYDALKPLL
jgi:hypothetical protein